MSLPTNRAGERLQGARIQSLRVILGLRGGMQIFVMTLIQTIARDDGRTPSGHYVQSESALSLFANLQGQTIALEFESPFQARGAPTRFHPAPLVARSTLPSSLLPDVSFKPSLQPSLKELKPAPSVAAMQKLWEETSLLLSGCMFLPCYLTQVTSLTSMLQLVTTLPPISSSLLLVSWFIPRGCS